MWRRKLPKRCFMTSQREIYSWSSASSGGRNASIRGTALHWSVIPVETWTERVPWSCSTPLKDHTSSCSWSKVQYSIGAWRQKWDVISIIVWAARRLSGPVGGVTELGGARAGAPLRRLLRQRVSLRCRLHGHDQVGWVGHHHVGHLKWMETSVWYDAKA